LQWEKEVFEKKAKVVALAQSEAVAMAGPANVDSILGQLLDDVLPMEFLMALVTVHMKDNTFLPCVIENFRKAQNGELPDQSKLLVSAAAQFHPTVVFSTIFAKLVVKQEAVEEGRPDDKTVAKISLKNTEISSKSRFFTRSRKKKATAKSVRKHSSVEFVKQVEEKTQVADQSRKMDASGKSQRTASHYRKKKSASQPIVDQSKDSLIRSAKVDRTVKTQVDDSSVKPRSNGVLGSQATQPKSA
uniref:FRIGIDA-like protein n=1 Tax=Heligmosomoides polygyrus TaxID=6339 RepID=A0A183GMR3_HELPZ